MMGWSLPSRMDRRSSRWRRARRSWLYLAGRRSRIAFCRIVCCDGGAFALDIFERSIGSFERCRLAGISLPPADDDITVAGIIFDDARMTAGLLCRDDRGAAASKGIEYDFRSPRDVPNGVRDHRNRLYSRVHSQLVQASRPECVAADVFPSIRSVAAMLTELNRVGMRRTAIFEYEAEL